MPAPRGFDTGAAPRVHARGRGTATDLAPAEITEWYLIRVWPAPAQDPAALRQTDSYVAALRAT